jgi:hypothetical protein
LSAWTEHCLQSSGYPFEAQLVIVTTKWNSFHTSCNLWYQTHQDENYTKKWKKNLCAV